MFVIDTANVHQALPEGCRLLLAHSWETNTRNGKAKVLKGPLTTTYGQPNQRVLFWPERDANPFFHFMECLWMMAGRRDVDWISKFSSNIRNYSDDGLVFNAAYGHRWRQYFGVDQLAEIIRNLRINPSCRRQVLTMWSARDLTHQDTKDVPCNTQAYFQVSPDGFLDMMVSNRSNDLIWGAYGANAVHFSFLLEVMASYTEMRLGTYSQVSMNTHVYEKHFALAETLAGHAADVMSGCRPSDSCPYERLRVKPYPVVGNLRWFQELELFLVGTTRGYTNPFFPEVALPLLEAWDLYKQKDFDRALAKVAECLATDWKLAAEEWLLRRTP